MNCEQFWSSRRKAFLESARQASSSEDVMDLCRQLLEAMKSNAMVAFPHEDVLRQQIALLFQSAMSGFGLSLARSQPRIVRSREATSPAPRRPLGALLSFLTNPNVLMGVLGAGLAFCLFAGTQGWRYAVFFAAAIGLVALSRKDAPASTQEIDAAIAVCDVRVEYLDSFLADLSRQMDARIADLKALLMDTVSPVSDVSLDSNALALCQYTWSTTKGAYLADSALLSAEKLLAGNDLEWVEYAPEARLYFDVMPTRKASRTVYPALRKISDKTLVRKGQYIESTASSPTERSETA